MDDCITQATANTDPNITQSNVTASGNVQAPPVETAAGPGEDLERLLSDLEKPALLSLRFFFNMC
jgi:hypothetical protein